MVQKLALVLALALGACTDLLSLHPVGPDMPPDPPPPPAPYAWVQGQWYAERLALIANQEVLSCTGRFVGTLSCHPYEQVSRGPGYMHVKQDTTTGEIAAAVEYVVEGGSGDFEPVADLGISDTVNVTITVKGPYFSSLPAVAGVQPRGLPAEFDLEWIGLNLTMSPHGFDKALSASMSLLEGEGIRLQQEQTIREEHTDSTGSYSIRYTSRIEALFVPTQDHLWPGHYVGTWTAADGRTDRATVTLSHFANWDERPTAGHVTAYLHEFTSCPTKPGYQQEPFRVLLGGGVGGSERVEFGTNTSRFYAGCPGSAITFGTPSACGFPSDYDTFRMTMARETRTVDMYMILDCGDYGSVRVDLEDAVMNGQDWYLYELTTKGP